MSLSQPDVFLGRALLAWGLVDRRLLVACADEVRRLAAQGHHVTLGQVLVQRGLLSPQRYQAIVARLRQVYAQSSGASPQVQRATEQMPLMSQSGRYAQQNADARPADESSVDRAVQGWQQVAGQVTASGSQIEIEFDFGTPATSTPGAPRAAPAPPPPPTTTTAPPAQGGAAGPRRSPADALIRRRMKVPPEQEQFAIGAWTVERYLAEGAYGVVYRVVRQGGDASPFALKVLKQLEPSEQVRQRFVQEARTMAKLRHPGIVHVHDAGVASGFVWFVMDFQSGPSLKDVLEERGKLPVAEGVHVLTRLCEAVEYAHGQAILHRDLKPENVIMSDGEPVLTDFGLAKDVDSGLNLTAEGQRIGTPLYMAPELILDGAKASPQSEVYALGALLYQALAGKVPFFAKSVVDLVDQIEKGDMTPLRKLCADAPRALEKLVTRALHKDPAKRPQTVAALREELAKAT